MNIGDRIKQRRIELGFDADDLAKKIGKSRATVYRYENGDIENMPTTVLEPIAKALNTTPAFLMGWEEPSTIFIADNLKTHNGFKNISIDNLSELTNISKHEINNILNNGRCPTSYVSRFSDALNVTAKYLDELYLYEITTEKLNDQVTVKLSVKIIQLLDKLNEMGCEEVYKRIEELTYIPKYIKNTEITSTQIEKVNTPNLKAAHERTDIDVTDEMRKHDDDIMNDDNEWE